MNNAQLPKARSISMTELQLKAEWEYRYAQRLGILCSDRQETFEQHLLAKAEADAVIAELKKISGAEETHAD